MATKHIFQYFKGIKTLKIIYTKFKEPLKLCGYINADWGGNQNIKRSTIRYIFTLARGTVSWESKRQ